VRDLVANLMAKLRRPNVQYPSSVATTESGAALGERAGTLSITSDVPDADVFVDGNPTGDKAGARAVQLDLPPGRHQVKVSKTGYLEHVETVQLAAARRVEVAARLVAEAQAVEAFKGGKTTVLAVSTRPEGAVVLLDGRPIGRSNGTFDVPPGPHVLRTRLDWYLDSEQQVVLEEGETRGIVVVLKPTFGSVEVTSATPANLYIGDREIGRAGPREPVKVARVVEGRHKLEAYAPGFFDLGQTIDVKAGERLVVALPPMRPSLGAFTIESAPPGAICEIDGVEKGRTPLTVDRLPQGAHEVRLTLPRHQALVRSEPAKAGETSLLKYVLDPTFTRLEVRSEPSRAKVWLDGKVEGETPLALDVDEGEHEVRIAADDRSHTAWSGRITAVRKRPISLERKLEPRYGRLVVTTQPPGAAITLDDQPLGASPFARDKVLGGPHKLSLRLDGYRPETLTADVVANRENRVDRALLRLLPREEAELRLREWDEANAMPVLWSRVALGSAVAGGLLAVVGALRWHGVSEERDALREAYRQASTDADARFAQLEAAARSEVAWGATTIGAAVLTAGLGALSAYLFATIPPRPEFAMEQP
jgi:hypothetical protein